MSTKKSRRRSREDGKLARQWTPTEIVIVGFIIPKIATTLYSLQKKTLLSPGVLAPALSRLAAEGFIVAHDSGARGRREFSVPRAVATTFIDRWRLTANNHIDDFEAVLKLCNVGEMADLTEAIEYVHSAGAIRERELTQLAEAAGGSGPPQVDFDYATYRAIARYYKLEAEVRTLRDIEEFLKTEQL